MSVKKRTSINHKQIQEYARLAFPLMSQHDVPPTPENYAIWYHFVALDIPELVQEMDTMIEEERPFTPEICDYLYRRYIANNLQKAVMERSTDDAQKLLHHIMQTIEGASDSTHNYSDALDKYSEDIRRKGSRVQDLSSVAEAIIEATNGLKERSNQLHQELQTTAKEVDSLRHDLRKVMLEAKKDFLTGVDNRQAFDEKLKEQVAFAQDEGKELCLLMMDIDHFKQFNDKFGHQVGDQVLKQVGRTLLESVKGNDIVARYGGEEFAVILPNTPLSGALVVAENLRQAVASKQLRRRDTGALIDKITLSAGAASWHHRGNDTIESLIRRADEALYRSKKGGRNKVTQESL